MQKLEAGSSYWIHFQHPKKGKLAIATNIVEVNGQLMCSNVQGALFSLPENILEVKKMHEFQRLQWMSRTYRRQGQVEEAEECEQRSYKVMPDEFYRIRVESLSHHWEMAGGIRSNALQEEVNRFRVLRPDINIDDLPCMQKERSRILDQLLADLAESAELQSKKPSLCDRISNLFSRRSL